MIWWLGGPLGGNCLGLSAMEFLDRDTQTGITGLGNCVYCMSLEGISS
jgi:hypothetical protein